MTTSSGYDHVPEQIAAWAKAPFPLLVCMNFRRPPLVAVAWRQQIRPMLAALGNPLRIDWESHDWIYDMRLAVRRAAVVLIDLTEASHHTARELRFVVREDLPLICYAHSIQARVKRISALGEMYPELVQDSIGASLNPDILGMRVWRADYEDAEDLAHLCERLRDELLPSQDLENPAAPYYDDLSQLTEEERQGVALAQIPRSRIIGVKDYWRDAAVLFSTSAIYRARVASWLANSRLRIKTPANLWIREHLLWAVRQSVRSGIGLSQSELATIDDIAEVDPDMYILNLAVEIRLLNRKAIPSSLVLPHVPKAPSLLARPSTARMTVHLSCHDEQIASFRSAEWSSCFPDSETFGSDLILLKHNTDGAMRCFRVTSAGPLPNWLEGQLGPIEDRLDELSSSIACLAASMSIAGFSPSEISTVLRVIVCLAVLQEAEKLHPGGTTGEQYYEDIVRRLAYIWGQDRSTIKLFEFSSQARGCHFRGFLLWPVLKPYVLKRYAQKAQEYLPEHSEVELIEAQHALAIDFLPAQIWDFLLLTEMNTAVPADLLRRVWVEFILPSAFMYWRLESIIVDPKDVDRWVYVITE